MIVFFQLDQEMYVPVKLAMSYIQEIKAWRDLTIYCSCVQSTITHASL